jgi:hypothetical protein
MDDTEKWTLEKYGPNLTLSEVSQVLKLPESTVRDWKSRGYFDGCVKKRGKHLSFRTVETLRRFESRQIPKPRPRKNINKEPIP